MTPNEVQKVTAQQKRAKKLAYWLLLYLIVVTVAVVWLGTKVFFAPEPTCSPTITPTEEPQAIEETQQTIASWYDYELDGIPWSLDHATAASREFERGTLVEVTNIENGKTVEVLINDYGPDESVHPDRALDLSSYAFKQIGNIEHGLVTVEYRAIGKGEYYPLAQN